MEVRLLGPVGLWHAGREAPLARSHRRCLLAILAMTPGQSVPSEVLIDRVWGDRVWGDRPPREAIRSFGHFDLVAGLGVVLTTGLIAWVVRVLGRVAGFFVTPPASGARVEGLSRDLAGFPRSASS